MILHGQWRGTDYAAVIGYMGYQQKVVCQISGRLKFQAKKTLKIPKKPKKTKKTKKNQKIPKNPKKSQKNPKNPKKSQSLHQNR